MAIGFFVNTWCALCSIPIDLVGMVLREVGWRTDFMTFEKKLYPEWLMARISVWDTHTKKMLDGLYAWNLIVARRSRKTSTADD